MTAFLAILFVLLTGFICSIISIASLHEEKSDCRASVDLAIYSVFGEYQKTLLDHYHIFGMDAGYESGRYSEDALLGRLQYYSSRSVDMDITDLQFLTDNHGAAFYEQVLFYMETIYGVELVREFTGLTAQWEEQMVQGEAQFQETDGLMEDLLLSSEDTQVLESSLLPLQDTSESYFLNKISPAGFSLSTQAFDTSQMPSKRTLNQGFGSFLQRDLTGIVNRLLFGEYLLQNLSCASAVNGTGGLAYELEYVIAGKGSDKANLESVAKKIMLLRFVPNYAYLQTDEGKRGEAEAIALLLTTALLMPELSEAVAQVILLVWAYQESLEDVKTLLSGGRVPLSKTSESWNSSLELLEGDSTLEVQGTGTSQDSKDGMSYKDYLRILLFLTDREKASMRALDAIEYAIRNGLGQENFRVDLCVSKMRVHSSVLLGPGVTFDFPTEYMYK